MNPTVALVLAVSFAAGLNVYLTFFALGLLARWQGDVLPGALGILTHPWVLALSGLLFAAEFFADKIPGLDLVWNAIHTVIRIPLAALMAYAASSDLSPAQQLLATALGTAIATIAHGTKFTARALVTPSPEPVSNIALSTASDATVVGLAWLSTHHPTAAATAAAVLLLLSAILLWSGYQAAKRVWLRLRQTGFALKFPTTINPDAR